MLLIGATLANLNVVNRLPSTVLENSVVVDTSGSWLASFREWIQKLSVKYIRSPSNIHPSSKPLALRYFASKHNRTSELFELDDSAPLPSSKLFVDFCDDLIRSLPSNVQNIVKDTVIDIQRLGEDCNALIEVSLESGRTFRCKSVIIGVSNLRPIIPTWIHRLNLINDSRIKKVEELNLNADSSQNLTGKTITIFGGGMTAGTMALQAISLGAKMVHLICRRHLNKKSFDCSPGWWGIKYLNAFNELADDRSRLIMCNKARGRGSILPMIWDELVKMEVDGKVNVLEGVEPIEYICDEQIHLHLTRNSQIRKRELSSLDDHVQPTPFAKSVADLLAHKYQGSREIPSPKHSDLCCDEIWIACGYSFDVKEHSILSTLMSKYPIDSVGGYPALTRCCSWPGLRVFLAGRGSMLTTGPCAANMVGMKMSADLVCSSIKVILSGDSEGEQDVFTDAPERASDADSETPFDPVNRVQSWLTGYVNTTDSLSDASIPLESENLIPCYQDVSHRKECKQLDIQDLDQNMKKVEMQSFSFMDDGFEISVNLNLPERIPQDSVRAKVTCTSLETWLVGKETAYHLHVPKLYGKVLPERTKLVVKEDKNRVIFTLFKEKDVDWKFLKG